MHYARGVKFGAGLHLLNILISDNRQTTTRSLMALFSTLLSLQLQTGELFETFARRMDQIIQRLHNWIPPVVLPETLLLYCALRALPDIPYGPVRHIILASPRIDYRAGMQMLKDVANTGAELIKSTLGSSSSSATTSTTTGSVLCSSECPPPRPSRQVKKTPKKGKVKRSPSRLCTIEGPCKHHGPTSLHSTSECKDPTLSRRKSRSGKTSDQSAHKKTTTDSPFAGLVESQAAKQSSVLYTPMFVTKISKAAMRYPRARFVPFRRSVSNHLRRADHAQSVESHQYDIQTVSADMLDSCIRAYTCPVHGMTTVPARRDLCTRRRTGKSRSDRRRARRRQNSRDYWYPAGNFFDHNRRSSPVVRKCPNVRCGGCRRPCPEHIPPRPRSKSSLSRPCASISSNEVVSRNYGSRRSHRTRRSFCCSPPREGGFFKNSDRSNAHEQTTCWRQSPRGLPKHVVCS